MKLIHHETISWTALQVPGMLDLNDCESGTGPTGQE